MSPTFSCRSGPRDEVIQLYQRGAQPRGITCVNFYKSELIFTILSLQFKTGIRLPLASSVKEIGAIYKNWLKYEPGINSGQKMRQETMDGFDGDADVLDFLTKNKGLGSGQRKFVKFWSHKICKPKKRKKAVLNSVWLKESY